MKLNKILALALSGVMAVSMLAGCSTDGKDEGNTEVVPTTSNAVSVMNDAQDYIEFKADADFDAALAAAAKKATQSEVANANYTVQDAGSSSVATELNKKLPVGESMTSDIIFSTAPTANNTVTTKTVLYYIANDGLTEKAAVEQVADLLKDSYYPEIVNISSANYKASYEGKISVVTVNTSDAGKTASAYYIAVSVTQTVGRDAVV